MSVAGKWYNELGSWMVLRVGRGGKSLAGKYHSAVGKAAGEYDLIGRLDSAPPKRKSQGIGWVVCWQNAKRSGNSVTAWSGQYRVVDGEEFIKTTWLLTSEGTPRDDWESTLIGKDTFSRKAPTPQQVARTKAMRGLGT